MRDKDYGQALDLLDREVLVVDGSGGVVYSNAAARLLIDPLSKDHTAPGTFHQLWSERPGEVGDLMRRIAGTSAWQPFTLTRAAGRHSGLRIPMRGRAFVGEDVGAPFVLLTSDAFRERAFDDHRRLIRHLNFRIAEGSRAETLLAKLLENEQRLRQELIHRVKNNLAMLMALLRLNERHAENPETLAQIEEMERRVLSISAVHDLLDAHDAMEYVQADELIERICMQLERALAPGTVSIRRTLVPVRLHISDATPLALIVNELVTNAIKHAFPDGTGGTISIHLKKNGVEKLEAIVEDDGVGVEMPVGEAVRGKGSVILQALAEQLQGKIVRTADSGTRWQLVFAPREGEESPHA